MSEMIKGQKRAFPDPFKTQPGFSRGTTSLPPARAARVMDDISRLISEHAKELAGAEKDFSHARRAMKLVFLALGRADAGLKVPFRTYWNADETTNVFRRIILTLASSTGKYKMGPGNELGEFALTLTDTVTVGEVLDHLLGLIIVPPPKKLNAARKQE